MRHPLSGMPCSCTERLQTLPLTASPTMQAGITPCSQAAASQRMQAAS